MKSRTLSLFLLLLLSFVCTFAEEGVQGVSDRSANESHVSFSSGGGRDRYSVSYQMDSDRFVVVFQSSGFHFRWKIGALVEYLENGHMPGYQPSEDAAGTIWRPAVMACSTLPDTHTMAANLTVYNYKCQSADGVLAVIAHVAPAPAARHKFDLLLDTQAFSWKLNGSRLALVASVQAATKVQAHVADEDGHELSHDSSHATHVQFGAEAFFSWASNVTTDTGATVPVIVSSALVVDSEDHEGDGEGEDSKHVIFAFDAVHPKRITWDPTVGLGLGLAVPASSSAASQTISSVSWWMVGVFFSAMEWLM